MAMLGPWCNTFGHTCTKFVQWRPLFGHRRISYHILARTSKKARVTARTRAAFRTCACLHLKAGTAVAEGRFWLMQMHIGKIWIEYLGASYDASHTDTHYPVWKTCYRHNCSSADDFKVVLSDLLWAISMGSLLIEFAKGAQLLSPTRWSGWR